MSRLLINDFAIPVSITLAEKVGLHEAVFLQQLHYWLLESENVHDEHKWVYNTYQGWHEKMPFLTVNQIRRIVRVLEKKNLIITGNFNQIKLDKTKWYRINYEAIEKLCEDVNKQKLLFEPCQNETCPQNEKIDEQSYGETNEPTRPSAEISSNETETPLDRFQETARPEREHRTIPKTTTKITHEKKKDDEEYAREANPFQFFEENGFGTVGGYLAEKILAWCQDLSTELVVEAMKLAVEFGCKNWKYVESILRQWADKSYQSVKDVHAARLHFEEKMAKK